MTSQEAYGSQLDGALRRESSSDLLAFVSEMVNEATPLFVSRSLLQTFAESLPKLKPEVHKATALQALTLLQVRRRRRRRRRRAVFVLTSRALCSRASWRLRNRWRCCARSLPTSYQAEEDFREAARTLIGIPLDSGQRVLDTMYKIQIYVRIARLFLEEDDSVEAERYLNRASEVIHLCTDPKVALGYRAAFVRILDYKRQFLKAALKYYQMSQEPLVSDDGQLIALDSAHKCAILAEAGPQRQRLLATLYKDERSSKAENYRVLEKMYLDRIITKREVETFAKSLQPHQMARLADNSTVLDRAVVEHNVLSASLLYNNVGFDQLAALLELDAGRAEKVAARMIMEERLRGSIDQVARVIHFETSSDERDALAQWDGRIRRACASIDEILADIRQRDPVEFAALLSAH